MYYKTYQQTIKFNSIEELEDLVKRLNISFDIYREKHKDFTIKIVEDRDNLKVIVKALYLEENVN